jgi:hypothetical protein
MGSGAVTRDLMQYVCIKNNNGEILLALLLVTNI